MAVSSRANPYAGSAGLIGFAGLRRTALRQSTVIRMIPARAETARSSHISRLAVGGALGSKMLLSVKPVRSPRASALEAPRAAARSVSESAAASARGRSRGATPRIRSLILRQLNRSAFPAFLDENLNNRGDGRIGGGQSPLGAFTPRSVAIQCRAMTLRAGVAKLAGAALAGALLIFAAPAAAQPCHPHHGGGNAEVGQYLENVPGPCGNQSIGGGGSGDQGTSSGSGTSAGLPSGTISQLASHGSSGAQAASFAEATNPGGPEPAASSGNTSGSSSGEPTDAAGGTDDGGSLLSALGHWVTGNDASASDAGQGLGTWLPIILIAVLIGGVATIALRRGRTG